ncbi:MAG: hypothetical protein JO112_18695, partial [Planctomycetes bacterium]|nr:hypothetical protein [Planctomycetota bacterium]
MFRAKITGTLVATLAWAGFCWGDPPLKPIPEGAPGERIITVDEGNQGPQSCRVLSSWIQADGTTATEVQNLATGEHMTIVDATAPQGTVMQQPMAVEQPAAPSTSQGKSGGRFFHLFHRDENPAAVSSPGTPTSPPTPAPAAVNPANAPAANHLANWSYPPAQTAQ